MTTCGDSESEVKARLSKAGRAFACLKNIWKSKKIRLKAKICFFRSNILSTLLYGCESWKKTKAICHKLDTILLPAPHPEHLLAQYHIEYRTEVYEVKKRRWRWIGHVLRMEPSTIPRVAMHWTPPGKWTIGRLKETWRRTVEKEMRANNVTWGELTKKAKDRQQWRALVMAFCAQGHEENWVSDIILLCVVLLKKFIIYPKSR